MAVTHHFLRHSILKSCMRTSSVAYFCSQSVPNISKSLSPADHLRFPHIHELVYYKRVNPQNYSILTERNPKKLMDDLPQIMDSAISTGNLSVGTFLLHLTNCFYEDLCQQRPWLTIPIFRAFIHLRYNSSLHLLSEGVPSHSNAPLLLEHIGESLTEQSMPETSEILLSLFLLGFENTSDVFVKLFLLCRKNPSQMTWWNLNHYFYVARNMNGRDFVGMRLMLKRVEELVHELESSKTEDFTAQDIGLLASTLLVADPPVSVMEPVLNLICDLVDGENGEQFIADTSCLQSWMRLTDPWLRMLDGRWLSVWHRVKAYWTEHMNELNFTEISYLSHSAASVEYGLSQLWVALTRRGHALLEKDSCTRDVVTASQLLSLCEVEDFHEKYYIALENALTRNEVDLMSLMKIVEAFRLPSNQVENKGNMLLMLQESLVGNLEQINRHFIKCDALARFFAVYPFQREHIRDELSRVCELCLSRNVFVDHASFSSLILMRFSKDLSPERVESTVAVIRDRILNVGLAKLKNIATVIFWLQSDRDIRRHMNSLETALQSAVMTYLEKREYNHFNLLKCVKIISVFKYPRDSNLSQRLLQSIVEFMGESFDVFHFHAFFTHNYSEVYCRALEKAIISSCHYEDPYSMSMMLSVLGRIHHQSDNCDEFKSACVTLFKRFLSMDRYAEAMVVLHNLALLQIFPEDALKVFFSEGILDKLQSQLSGWLEQLRARKILALFSLNLATLLECPHLAVPWVFKDQPAPKFHTGLSYNERSVADVLASMLNVPSVTRTESFFPYYEIYLNEKGQVTPSIENQSTSDDWQRVAVVVANPLAYCFEFRRPTGHLVMSVRMLKLLGFRVTVIPIYDWNGMALSDHSSKMRYLREKIARSSRSLDENIFL